VNINIIKTEEEYNVSLAWVDAQFENAPLPDSPEGEQLQVALALIKQYEDMKHPIPYPDPIDAVRAKMKERGLRNRDLVGKVGSKGYVSALLNKRKPLTLELARYFHREMGIPADVLLS